MRGFPLSMRRLQVDVARDAPGMNRRTAAAGSQVDVGGAHARVRGRRRLIPQPRHHTRRVVLHQHRVLAARPAFVIDCRVCRCRACHVARRAPRLAIRRLRLAPGTVLTCRCNAGSADLCSTGSFSKYQPCNVVVGTWLLGLLDIAMAWGAAVGGSGKLRSLASGTQRAAQHHEAGPLRVFRHMLDSVEAVSRFQVVWTHI